MLSIHAVGLDLTWWDHQFAALGGAHDVAAFDLPGHGVSGGFDAAPTFEALASVAADVIVAVGAGPAYVVSISVGA